MDSRKLRRKSKEEKMEKVTDVKVKTVKKERKKVNKLTLISRIIMLILTVAVIAIVGIVIYLKVLPTKYLIPVCVAIILLFGAGIFMVFRKKELKIFRIILSVINVLLIGVSIFAGLKLVKTMDFLGNMTTETVNAKTYSVVVLKDSEYTKIEDIQYKLVLYYDTDMNQNKDAIDKLTEVMTIVAEKTDDVHELANKLINKDVDAILIEDSYYGIIEEEMLDFREKTNVVYTFTLEDTIQTIVKNVSVTEEPFNVYISGIDSYGKISSVSRSDVNMFVSVNPKTKQVLLVNIPRDYYVKLHGTRGYRDKLTHAGIYGIDMSVKTVEDLLNVDVNYYVRVNFTSLVNIIDAIGGINVYSEHAFTSRIGNFKFVKGYNQMSGEQALGFARERYSFAEGDRMRGQNQQAVIDAVIKKVSSSTTMLTKFDALLDSLEGSFQTNMDYTKMVELVRMQITDNASWNITSIGIDGAGSMERTYSMGKTLLSVLIPYAGSVNKAESMIKSVLNGEILESGNIDISNYNDYLVVSRGVYETEKEEEKQPEQVPEVTPETEVPEVPNSGETQTPDGGSTEVTPPSTGNTETGKPDSGSTEVTPPSTGNTETETPDSGSTEVTPPSTGNTEQETPDGGSTEVIPPSTENTEAETPDSGSTEVTPPSTGNTGTETPDGGSTEVTPPSTGDNDSSTVE